MIEEKLKKIATEKAVAPTTLEDLRNQSFSVARQLDAHGEATNTLTGAAAAAGVLTAIDEDDDGGAEADLPREFEYFSDGEDDE